MSASVSNVLPMPLFTCIVAAQKNGGIGADNTIPWTSKIDMAFFRKTTTSISECMLRNCVIMGRKTWDSLPQFLQPLSNRLNIVITRSPNTTDLESIVHTHAARSFDAALDLVQKIRARANAAGPDSGLYGIEKIFVIGGAEIYSIAMQHPMCSEILWTHVKGAKAECDAFIEEPSPEKYALTDESVPVIDRDLTLIFRTYTARNTEEMQYLDLVRKIIDTGYKAIDRTKVGTLSLFGEKMCFDLRYHFPLFTSKRVFRRAVIEELVWILSGSTNSNVLRDKRVNIWNDNTTREFLDKRGLEHLKPGDIGAGYGFQCRHFGAEYRGMDADYTGEGVDQLANVIHLIKTDPNSRRIVMNFWNVSALDKMALPPCHMFCQFYVADGRLSCVMYQRSADMGLGVPFNVASYSLLTCMIAHVCNLLPGTFTHMIGNAHVYLNHVKPLQQQIQREPYLFPSLTIADRGQNIDEFVASDFTFSNYKSHPSIKMEMAV